jgi:Glycosyl transferase family 1
LASIVYAMSGEGRGHATRARVVVEALRARHRVTLFASDCAYAMLEARYRGTDVRMHRIAGLRFAYAGPGRVSLFGTLRLAAQFRMSLEGYVTEVMPEIERCRPDLVIADFEPILPRAARRARVPFVSFDHQHYLVAGDLSELPFLERSGAGWCVRGELTDRRIGAFLEAAPTLRPSISAESVCGNAAAIAALEAELGAAPRLVPRPRQPAVAGRGARAVTAGWA